MFEIRRLILLSHSLLIPHMYLLLFELLVLIRKNLIVASTKVDDIPPFQRFQTGEPALRLLAAEENLPRSRVHFVFR